MLDLEYWANPEKYIDNFLAIFWSTKNIIVPVAEKEVFYKNFVYSIEGLAYELLCDARRDFNVLINFKDDCKTVKKARDVNGYFMVCLRSIKNKIENSKKEGRISKSVLNYPDLRIKDSLKAGILFY